MLISYVWITLIMFAAVCVLVAPVFILLFAQLGDRRRKPSYVRKTSETEWEMIARANILETVSLR